MVLPDPGVKPGSPALQADSSPTELSGKPKECSEYYCTIAFISHTSKVILKILQARLQKYVNCEPPDVQARFRKARGNRDQIAKSTGSLKKQEFQKNIYFCFTDYTKAFDYVNHNKLWEILQEMGIPDHLTCLQRSLYAGQEATVRTWHRTTGCFQIGKGVSQGCILSPCLFNLNAEYIMQCFPTLREWLFSALVLFALVFRVLHYLTNSSNNFSLQKSYVVYVCLTGPRNNRDCLEKIWSPSKNQLPQQHGNTPGN